MENKPINSEAFGYVRLNVPEKVNLEEFIIIEKFVREMHDSFLPNGIYGDGDLRKFVHEKLNENDLGIPFHHVDNIVNALFEFLFDNDTLLPTILSVNLENWKDWKEVLRKSIRSFISSYGFAPNILSLSNYTKSQIELVSRMRTLSSFCFMETIGKEVNICTLKFYLNDSLADRNIILEYIPCNEDDDDDSLNRVFPINTPSPASFIEGYI